MQVHTEHNRQPPQMHHIDTVQPTLKPTDEVP
jgi:hypothetical protein